MDGRMRRFGRQASPERSMVWVEPPPKNRRPPQQGTRRVPVVYYLSRNRHLERPHFIEVPISSPDGLYLRDVIDRLNVLRGKGMPAMYSWSCKRSYQNGYVWHDLAEDDLVTPASGGEYVLKGSELLGQPLSERLHHSSSSPQLQSREHPRQEPPTSSRTQQAHSSSSSPVEARPPPPFRTTTLEDELSPTSYRRGSHPSPEKGSLGLVEYRVRKANGRVDASTQTEDGGRRRECGPGARQKGVSTDDDPLDLKFKERNWNWTTCFNEGSKNGRDEISPPPTSSGASSPSRRMNTLESLIRADACRMKDFRIFEKEEEEVLLPMKAKLKVANILLLLITCGSISLKVHHSFGPVLTYKPRFCCMKFPSQMLASSIVLLSENPRVMGLRQEERRCCSGSMIETEQQKEEGGGR